MLLTFHITGRFILYIMKPEKGVAEVYMQKKEELYSIGEVSKICNISKKALRFYDQIGIIAPDVICKENGYRYYNRQTLLTVPVVKYYKQMGFKLEEMQGLVEGNTYYFLKQNFLNKIDELREQEQAIHNSYVAVKDWYELIQEAQLVSRSRVQEVGVKYINATTYCCMEQDFAYRYMESIINIDSVSYTHLTLPTGPVILKFPSWTDKMNGTCSRAYILQQALRPCTAGTCQTVLGGVMAATVYHLGPLEEIGRAYAKIRDWAAARGYECGPESYERYVVDYWTTRNQEEFVTEVIVPLAEE